MQFRKIGLPVIVSSLMGFVFMGPQSAPSQSPAPQADPATQPANPYSAAQDTLQALPTTYIQRFGDPKLAELQNQEAQADLQA
jgi:hypothetical protein